MIKKFNGKTYNSGSAVKVEEHNLNEGSVKVNEVLYEKRTKEYFLHTTKQSGENISEDIKPMTLVEVLDWEYNVGSVVTRNIEKMGIRDEKEYSSVVIYYKVILDNLKKNSDYYVNDLIVKWTDEGTSVMRIKNDWKEILEKEYSDKGLYNSLEKWEKEHYDKLIQEGFDMDMLSRKLVYEECVKQVVELEDEYSLDDLLGVVKDGVEKFSDDFIENGLNEGMSKEELVDYYENHIISFDLDEFVSVYLDDDSRKQWNECLDVKGQGTIDTLTNDLIEKRVKEKMEGLK